VFAGAALRFAPCLALLSIVGAMMIVNPSTASVFGVHLLLGPAVPAVLVALTQMFVIGGGEVDLGVGAFAGSYQRDHRPPSPKFHTFGDHFFGNIRAGEYTEEDEIRHPPGICAGEQGILPRNLREPPGASRRCP
jgi:hypothetical protein